MSANDIRNVESTLHDMVNEQADAVLGPIIEVMH